jgi:hypothetical protein
MPAPYAGKDKSDRNQYGPEDDLSGAFGQGPKLFQFFLKVHLALDQA